ncbi:MAG TPA: DUF4446 family protein [Nocardioidaceae bacterium]|nr:DUF4446 family protein [Nocardioidaceae bacterium]
MSTSELATTLAVVAVVLGVVALVVAATGLRRSAPGHARRTSARRSAASLPTDVEGLRSEVHSLRVEVSQALRHLAVVRYDAFGDMGGHLSWSMALLDDSGDGVVLTSIHGRSEARTYAKNVASWKCEQALSPEEEEAIKFAENA